jgi:hypothetical protein
MPGSGSLIIRPIEAHFLDGGESLDHMSPYCDLQVGNKHCQTEICQHGGANPRWHHPLVLPVSDKQVKCSLEIKDDLLTSELGGNAGRCDIDLEEIKKAGNVRKWYSLYKDGHCEGDILVEASFLSELPPFFGTKSSPCQQCSNEIKKENAEKSEEAAGRQVQRKRSECVQGRGWNMYVPGEEIEEDLEEMEDLTLKKCKSAMPQLDQDAGDIKIERRKSFWEKMLHI